MIKAYQLIREGNPFLPHTRFINLGEPTYSFYHFTTAAAILTIILFARGPFMQFTFDLDNKITRHVYSINYLIFIGNLYSALQLFKFCFALSALRLAFIFPLYLCIVASCISNYLTYNIDTIRY